MLEKRVKRQLLDEVQSICPPHVTIMQVRQGLAKGLGHAVLCAHPVVGDEPVAVICLMLFWMNMNPICHRITWQR